MRMGSGIPLAWVSCFPLGSDMALECYLEVLKPVVAFLRVSLGILLAIYMDDILIQGSSPSQVYLHA